MSGFLCFLHTEHSFYTIEDQILQTILAPFADGKVGTKFNDIF